MDDDGWLVRGVSADHAVRVLGVRVGNVAERVRRAHALSPGAARLAAEGVVCTALLAAFVKGEERLTLQVQASEPACSFMGDIDGNGRIRARFSPRWLAPGTEQITGALLAIKTDGQREVYRGVTAVPGVSLSRALALHLEQSAQVEAVLRVYVAQTQDGAIRDCGGFYLEQLPGRPEDGPRVADRIAGRSDRDVLDELGLGLMPDGADGPGPTAVWGLVGLERRPLVWSCACSLERVEAMLLALGAHEIADLRTRDGKAEVTCEFCNTRYTSGPAELERLEAAARAREA